MFLTVSAFSQSNVKKEKETKNSQQVKANTEEPILRPAVIAASSQYHNLDNAIKDVLINNVIPNDFPKSITERDRAKYIDNINLWIKQNPSFVKPNKMNVSIK